MKPQLAKPSTLYRTEPARGIDAGDEPAVERDGGDYGAGLVRGVAVITRGEALGHGEWVDADMLSAVAGAINAAGKRGVKSRFTHPDLSGDGLGKNLGRIKHAQIDGDVVRADLHMSRHAHDTPDGDLAGYVLELAEQDPDSFGLSIAFRRDWDAEDQHRRENKDGEGRFVSPDELNEANLPHVRLKNLTAVDAVDEPAANPTGLFRGRADVAAQAERLVSYALGLTDETPEATLFDIDPSRVRGFVSRMFDRRGLSVVTDSPKEPTPMSGKQQTQPATPEPSTPAAPPAAAPAAPAEPTPETYSADQLAKAKAEAVAAERKRQSDIRGLCSAAGMPEKADAWCADAEFSAEDAKDQLFTAMCKRNPSPDDDPASDPGATKADPDAAFKAEYAEARDVYERQGVTEEQYVASRKRDEAGGRVTK